MNYIIDVVFDNSYDGNNFKSEVEVDFVLREIHGRTDIGYSATAKDVS